MGDDDWDGSTGGDDGLMCTAGSVGQPVGLVNTMMHAPNAVALGLMNRASRLGAQEENDWITPFLDQWTAAGRDAATSSVLGIDSPSLGAGVTVSSPAGATNAQAYAGVPSFQCAPDDPGVSSQPIPVDHRFPGLDAFHGTRHDTNYVPSGYGDYPTVDGKPIFYTYDDDGKPFFVVNGEVRNIPAPYDKPSLSALQQGNQIPGFFDGMGSEIGQSWRNLKSTMGKRYDDLGLLGTVVVTGLDGVNAPFATVGQVAGGTVGAVNNAYQGDWYNAGRNAGTATEGLTSAAMMAFGPKVMSVAGQAAAPYLSRFTAPIAAAGAPIAQRVNAGLDWFGNTGFDAADAVMGRGAPWREGIYGYVGGRTESTNVASNGSAQGVRNQFSPSVDQPPLLTYSNPTTYTINQIVGMSHPERWQAGEQFIQELYGSPGQQSFSVPSGGNDNDIITGSGGRHVDAPVPTDNGGILANEVKTYNPWTTVSGQKVQKFVPLSDAVKQQVLKDSWLSANLSGYKPRWNFIGASPSPELDQYLTAKGIDYIIYH